MHLNLQMIRNSNDVIFIRDFRLSTWILSILVVFTVLCISIYRLTFHPLARYPGPFLAKITDAYAAYHGWGGDVHLDVHRLHKRYGTFVRYGPNRLLVNSSNGLRDIYGYGKNVQKSKVYLPMVPQKHAWSTLTTIDKRRHRFKRALISSQLNTRNIEEFEPALHMFIQDFCSKLSKGSTLQTGSKPRNMAQWCEFFTLDVIGAFAFGQKLDMLGSSKHHFVMDALHKYSRMMGIYLQMPCLSKLRLEYVVGLVTSWTKSQKSWKTWSSDFANQVLDINGRERKGMFSHIVEARDPDGNQLKTEELWAEGIFLFLAGFDTSATTIAALFYYLARSPSIYARVQEEVRLTFPDPAEIRSGSKLSSCTYLNACITEALRMSPATPGFPLREVLSPGLVVHGQRIPPGIDVGSCIYALHHNADYFEDADEFIPERWITPRDKGDKDWEERLARQMMAYSPFSIGPRSCPGRQFATMEISLLLANILSTLEFTFAEVYANDLDEGDARIEGRKDSGEYRLRAHVTSSGNGPFLSFRKRD